jgi:hypothetical protein
LLIKNILDFTLLVLKVSRILHPILNCRSSKFCNSNFFKNLYIFNVLYLLVGKKLNLDPDPNLQIISDPAGSESTALVPVWPPNWYCTEKSQCGHKLATAEGVPVWPSAWNS